METNRNEDIEHLLENLEWEDLDNPSNDITLKEDESFLAEKDPGDIINGIQWNDNQFNMGDTKDIKKSKKAENLNQNMFSQGPEYYIQMPTTNSPVKYSL